MTKKKLHIDPWALGALSLWMVIFVMGLFPEMVFLLLREAGYVVTIRALINSHWFISLACTGYLGWFVFKRCIECDEQPDIALGKSVQVMILAMTAFLPVHMERVILYLAIPLPLYRYLILTVIAIKGVAWLFLVNLLLRYYLISGHRVFKNMPLIFPSAMFVSPEKASEEDAPAEDADTEKDVATDIGDDASD